MSCHHLDSDNVSDLVDAHHLQEPSYHQSKSFESTLKDFFPRKSIYLESDPWINANHQKLADTVIRKHTRCLLALLQIFSNNNQLLALHLMDLLAQLINPNSYLRTVTDLNDIVIDNVNYFVKNHLTSKSNLSKDAKFSIIHSSTCNLSSSNNQKQKIGVRLRFNKNYFLR